jgi:hypothetical protein
MLDDRSGEQVVIVPGERLLPGFMTLATAM